MVAKRPELLEASNETIEDALLHANPMVLRGLLFQLTGDETLASVKVDSVKFGLQDMKLVTDPADLAMIRSKAAAFLRSYRDAGAGEIPIGPQERLQRSLSLTAAVEIPSSEFEMWLEQLALDPFARGLTWSEPPPQERLEQFSVVVIGAGMGGLNAAVQLSHAGIRFAVLEKNPGVGGTWYENRYPGARVDTPSRIYTHIFGADFEYPNSFCEQSENEKYVNWIADHYEIRRLIEFDTEVKSIVWDESAKVWEIAADQPDGPRVWRANAVITAVGLLSRPNVPEIAGLEDFGGPAFHSARWPSGLDLTGKRVGVVGSGCTGYQLVPELVDLADHVYLFQRHPSWVFDVPDYLRPYAPQVTWLDRNFPYLTNFVRFFHSWTRGPSATMAANEVDPEFSDPHAVSAANKSVRDGRIAFMQSKLADRPDLMEKMLPDAPPLSTRPVLADREYCIYDAVLRDDVTVVSNGIRGVTEDAVILEDGSECPVDVIVLATGFRANKFLWPMEVRGRDGRGIEDLWAKDGGRAYLGNMVPGFPNFFMLYGPNSNANVGFSAIHLEELVTRFALECVDALITQDKSTVEVTFDAFERYNEALDTAASSKVYLDPRAHGYFKNEFGRCATNGAFDARLLWRWLRSPAGPGPDSEDSVLEERLEQTRGVISPYFGRDLVLG